MWAAFGACARVRGFAATKRARVQRAGARVRGFAATARATVRRAGAQEGCGHHAVARRRRALSGIGAAAQSACCSASILIARDRARGCNSYFLNVSGYWQA